MATGATSVDFGTTGDGSYASVDVTGQSGLSAPSFIEAFKMAEATADNTADAHVIAPFRITCEYLTSTSFRIHVFSEVTARGLFAVRWVTSP